MDFPDAQATPLSISTYTTYSIVGENQGSPSLRTAVSSTWGTANRAMYLPFWLPWPYYVQRVFWGNGSALGNMDFGIYTLGFQRLFSTGSTAQSGASDIQYANAGVLLPPGRYYMALNNNGTTNRVLGNVSSLIPYAAHAGALRQTSAFPLPDPMVPTTFTAEGSNVIPLCGITRTSSGF